MQQIPRRIFIGGSLGLAATVATRPSLAAGNTDLTVGVPTNLTGLDPADVNDTLSQSACRLMMQGLYGFDKDMNLIPRVGRELHRERGLPKSSPSSCVPASASMTVRRLMLPR